MASKRDKLRQMNQKNSVRQEEHASTLVSELVENYDEVAEDSNSRPDSDVEKNNKSEALAVEKSETKKTIPVSETQILNKDDNPVPEVRHYVDNIDTSDLVGTARRRVSQRRSKNGSEKLQKLSRTTISLSENNEEFVMGRCEETGASITVVINKIIKEYRELKGLT